MIDKKIIDAASQAAAAHVSDVLTNIHANDRSEQSVYSAVIQRLIQASCLDEVAVMSRINIWARKNYPNEKDILPVIVNLMKGVSNPNLGRKVFIKLVEAIFPAE